MKKDAIKKPKSEVELPSGAKLNIGLVPFADGQALLEVVMKELKDPALSFNQTANYDFLKNVAAVAFSSPEVKAAIHKCLERSTYNGKKFDEDTFEPEEARQDYIPVMYAVGEYNLMPFMKSLYAQFQEVLTVFQGAMEKDPS